MTYITNLQCIFPGSCDMIRPRTQKQIFFPCIKASTHGVTTKGCSDLSRCTRSGSTAVRHHGADAMQEHCSPTSSMNVGEELMNSRSYSHITGSAVTCNNSRRNPFILFSSLCSGRTQPKEHNMSKILKLHSKLHRQINLLQVHPHSDWRPRSSSIA